MKKFLLSIVLLDVYLIITSSNLSAQIPGIQWQKSLGGTFYEVASCIKQTADSGYIVAGYSNSNDGDVTGHHGSSYYNDYWIVKLNSSGIIQWQKSLGGNGEDKASAIQQTNDGGYIVAGLSTSNDGDVSGNHGLEDYWIVKLDASGAIQWQKSLGGSSYDFANSIQQTTDGGYIISGFSNSTDGDITGHHGTTNYPDYWIVKLNSSGIIEWQKSLGGSEYDKSFSIEQTNDGGYIIAGESYSNDGDVTGHHGSTPNNDYWIVKTNPAGTIEWQKSLGGTGGDLAYSIHQTTDGGYVIAGPSSSNNGDVSGNHLNFGYTTVDYWIVKLNASGTIEWQKCLGGSRSDYAYSVNQIADNGYIVIGATNSMDGDVTELHGGNTMYNDYWVVKLSLTGDLEWQRALGGFYEDMGYYAIPTYDNGFIVAGGSKSNDGDVSGHHGVPGWSFDFWIIKLLPGAGINEISNNKTIKIYPNPVVSEATIEIGENNGTDLYIYNLSGKEVIRIMHIQQKTHLDVSSLSAGIYLVKVNLKDGRYLQGKFAVLR